MPLVCEFCGEAAGACDCDDFTTAHLREPKATGEEESMESRFLAIKGVLVNPNEIETVDLNDDGSVLVHFQSGNNRTFTDEDAEGLRQFFAPLSDVPPTGEKPAKRKA